MAAADEWIAAALDADTANEYTDAQEEDGGDTPDGVDGEPLDPRDQVIAQLQARLESMEKLVQDRSSKPLGMAATPKTKTTLLTRSPGDPGRLSDQEMERLRAAFGPAPHRLGKGDASVQMHPALSTLPEQVFAEENREVLEAGGDDLIQSELAKTLEGLTDPVHKLLALQLRQTADLMKALAPKTPVDPLSAILSGSDSGSGASSAGSVNVKGYAAREAFLRQLEDDAKVVQVIRTNARNELGVTAAKEEPSLLRQYLETRVPVGDLKTMGQLGHIMAFGWEQAATTQNIQMMAFCGRMMGYVEQACLDSGKTHLAWLLTGLTEPNMQMLAVNRRRPTLSPFAKLPSATWVAANVSYLKDIDMFETRLRQIGAFNPKSNVPASQSESSEVTQRPKGKPKKQKGGKGSNQTSEDPPPV